MKQSAFSRPPCRLIWYALVPLSLIFAFCFFLNGAIADEEPSLWETAVVSNPNPQDRLNLREQPSEAAASLGKYSLVFPGKPNIIVKSFSFIPFIEIANERLGL